MLLESIGDADGCEPVVSVFSATIRRARKLIPSASRDASFSGGLQKDASEDESFGL